MLDKLSIIQNGLSLESRQILEAFRQYVSRCSFSEVGNITTATFRDLLILREKYERLYQQKLELDLENRKLKQQIANIQRIVDGD